MLKVYPWLIDLIHCRKNCPTGMISGWVRKVTEHRGTIQYLPVDVSRYVPSVILAISYSVIFIRLRVMERKVWRRTLPSASSAGGPEIPRQVSVEDKVRDARRMVRRWQVAKMMLCTFIVYAVCYIPVSSFFYVVRDYYKPPFPMLLAWLITLSYVGPFCNPVIFVNSRALSFDVSKRRTVLVEPKKETVKIHSIVQNNCWNNSQVIDYTIAVAPHLYVYVILFSGYLILPFPVVATCCTLIQCVAFSTIKLLISFIYWTTKECFVFRTVIFDDVRLSIVCSMQTFLRAKTPRIPFYRPNPVKTHTVEVFKPRIPSRIPFYCPNPVKTHTVEVF